jgi:hypothetical protein
MSAAFSHEQPSGRMKPGGPATSGERSGDRVVKRGPPRSHLHRAAPSFSVPGLHVASSGALPFGADDVEGGTRRDSAWVGTRRKPRNESHRPDGIERCRATVAAPGDDEEHEWSITAFRSAEVGRTHRFPRGTYAISIAGGRAEWLEGTAHLAVTARGGRESERDGAGVVARLFQRRCEAARVSCAQASSGSHPEGCGLGDSGSLRAASA